MYLIKSRTKSNRQCVVIAESMEDACTTYHIEPDSNYPNNAFLVKGRLKNNSGILVSVTPILHLCTSETVSTFFLSK